MRPPRLTMRAASFSALAAPEHSSTYCTPLPPVMRCTAATASSLRDIDDRVGAEPSCPSPGGGRACRSGSPAAAPSALATPTPISPIGPGPITTTPSPAMMPAHHVEPVHRRAGGDDQASPPRRTSRPGHGPWC